MGGEFTEVNLQGGNCEKVISAEGQGKAGGLPECSGRGGGNSGGVREDGRGLQEGEREGFRGNVGEVG